jgi:hypothetical protein
VTEAVHRARGSGYDGAIYYCVDGHAANRTSAVGTRAANATCDRVYTVEYLIKVLRDVPSVESQPADPSDFLSAAEPLMQRLNFSRIWSLQEAAWQCSDRYRGLSESVRSRDGRGVVTGYILETDSRKGCLFVEDLLWDDLEVQQRKLLLQQLLNCASRSAQIAVVPLWGYTGYDVLYELGFRKSPRRLNVYLSLWNGANVKSAFSAMYIDAL